MTMQKIEELKEWLKDGITPTCEGCIHDDGLCRDIDKHDCRVATRAYKETLNYVEKLFGKGE